MLSSTGFCCSVLVDKMAINVNMFRANNKFQLMLATSYITDLGAFAADPEMNVVGQFVSVGVWLIGL